MVLRVISNQRSTKFAMSLVELLIVVGVIAIVATIAIPTIGRLRESAVRAAAMQNAKNIQTMSAALDALGVAHVIPDSMGGVAATARLLREGVIVPEGPMAGEKFILSGMPDSEIDEVSEYLYVQYGRKELMLVYRDPQNSSTDSLLQLPNQLLCRMAPPVGHFYLQRVSKIRSLRNGATMGVAFIR